MGCIRFRQHHPPPERLAVPLTGGSSIWPRRMTKRRQRASGTCLPDLPPGPGPPWSSKRDSEGIPATLREETAHTGFPSPHVWQLVLRINAIYEARRGKKRVKRLSQSTESNSGKGRGPATVLLPQESENRISLPLSLSIHHVSPGLHALTSAGEPPSLLNLHGRDQYL